MSPKSLLPLLTAAFLLLSACSPAVESASEPAVPEPTEPEPVQMEEPAQETEHLPGYESFDWYNGSDEHEFQVSEAEYDGALCYKLEDPDAGIALYVPPRDKTSDDALPATLCYGGRTLSIDLPVFNLFSGLAGGISSFQAADLTGDGTPEFICLHGGSGTGVLMLTAEVYDLSTMTHCPILVDRETLPDLVTLTPVEVRETDRFDGRELVYQVTGPDGQTGYAADSVPEAGLPDRASPCFGNYEYYRVEDGQLWLGTGFFSDQASLLFNHLGFLEAPLTYDGESGTFSIQSPFTLTLSDPISYP